MTPAELRAWRLEHDLTQRELALIAGYSISTIERWESGKVPIPHWAGEWLHHQRRHIRLAKQHTQRHAVRKRLGPRRTTAGPVDKFKLREILGHDQNLIEMNRASLRDFEEGKIEPLD